MTHLPVSDFTQHTTPFYYYDLDLLRATLEAVKSGIADSPFHVHYAMKANANPAVLAPIVAAGLGVDCVSGGEVKAAVAAGFPAEKIFFAGVGKSDAEIDYALDAHIGCFNVESLPELEIIAEMAAAKNVTANVAIRVNPNIDAHTHSYITTGLNENKFGIALEMLDNAVAYCLKQPNIHLCGLHFHIGSQLIDLEPYKMLCERINKLVADFAEKGVHFDLINVGGGLGIDYDNPDANPISDFKSFFEIFRKYLTLSEGQQLHFELGRSIVGQCGSLITKVIYVKEGVGKKFVIVDAGMTDLIRPALYQAHHKIENITSTSTATDVYDVVGPICESSDCFGVSEQLPVTKRGDLIALRSAGAYGEIMAMHHYNMRDVPSSFAK
jgi:diaminopimelate decarboxylase